MVLTNQSPISNVFPTAPAQYNQNSFNQFIAIIRRAFNQLQNPVYLSTQFLNISNIPTSGFGLRVGDVYSYDGYLKIVQAGDLFIDDLVMDVTLKSVSVVVT